MLTVKNLIHPISVESAMRPMTKCRKFMSKYLPLFAILFAAIVTPAHAGGEATVLLAREHPLEWKSDGMWSVSEREDGVEFLKDKQPMHNSMCWTKLARPPRQGDTLEIVYRMEVPYKHVDLFIGKNCERPDATKPMPEFAEVISLGGIDSTGWQTRRLTVTSDEKVDTLGFLSWGWKIDRGTWMRVARIRVLPAKGENQWHVWRVGAPMNDRTVPERSPLQDFFPFGVYLPMEFSANFKHEGLNDRWEWLERALADIAKRGMNFTSVTNLSLGELDRLAALHEKHGLRMNPQMGQLNLKHVPEKLALKRLTRTVARYRGRSVIAGWAVGEEFHTSHIPLLDLPHEIVHAVDPSNSLALIQHKTELFRLTGQKLDVRIAWRDIYPFFADPRHGPTTFGASMNYYEDELDKCQRLLPRGASLCAMPQAQHEFYGGRFVYRKPTPAEIRLQAWAALAKGAKGIAYFLYPSRPPKEKGQPSPMEGLRLYDGKPTPQLEAVTDLARRLVPHGPTIVRWTRYLLPAATDRQALRAYLFKGHDSRAYAVLYNRGVEGTLEGRVRFPFRNGVVHDLIAGRDLKVELDENATILAIRFGPGDGTILRLSGTLPETTDVATAAEIDVPHVSGRPRPDLPLKRQPEGYDLFSYNLNLGKAGVPPGEAISKPIPFRRETKPGAEYISGVYGGAVTMRFTMPRDILSMTADASFGNYADGRERIYSLLYSTDGTKFLPLAKVTAGSGSKRLTGQIKPPAGTHQTCLRCVVPDHNPHVVLHGVRVRMNVRADEKKPNPKGVAWVSGRPRPDLPLTKLQDGRRLLRYKVDIQKTGGLPEGDEMSRTLRFSDFDRLGHKYMSGLYGRHALLRFDVPGTIAKLEAAAVFANHMDRNLDTYSIDYSLDGRKFTTLAKLEATSGAAHRVSGHATPPPGSRKVWLSFKLPRSSKAIVLKHLDVKLVITPNETD